jgi:hypothetical protein
MKNQLFRILPDENTLLKLLSYFGIKSLQDNYSFTIQNLIDLNTKQNILNDITHLTHFYLPCKSKIYLDNLTEKKCITILRQFLKIHNYNVISKEKYHQGKKILSYHINPIKINMNTNKKNNVIISFD